MSPTRSPARRTPFSSTKGRGRGCRLTAVIQQDPEPGAAVYAIGRVKRPPANRQAQAAVAAKVVDIRYGQRPLETNKPIGER